MKCYGVLCRVHIVTVMISVSREQLLKLLGVDAVNSVLGYILLGPIRMYNSSNWILVSEFAVPSASTPFGIRQIVHLLFSAFSCKKMFFFVGFLFPQAFGEMHPTNPKVVSDMTSLHHIHEAGILHNLGERAKLRNQRPYTFMVGGFLASARGYDYGSQSCSCSCLW